MSKRKAPRQPALPKEQWHLYSLQALPPNKFAAITGQILLNPKLLVGIRNGFEFQAR